LQSQLNALAQQDVVEYQSVATANQAQWNNMGDHWLKAVSNIANAQTQSTRTEREVPPGIPGWGDVDVSRLLIFA
jgi:hypothetical protein